MEHSKIKNHKLGNLRIYVEPSHKIRHGDRTLFRKLFPKSAYLHIIKEAQKDGIINATVHNTHTSFTSDGKIVMQSAEGDSSQLAMVVELIDKREKLETFFLKHKDLLHNKVVIYKEVEFWDVE
ncbi:hypothetical protein A9P82_06380 [Arachidicoccus ginsenosidimutans]|uniref:DUF190 domain-containing protein n=1 Tax=Arachidicoccus sp. BS20 TaxID=1850526 RepID=UPI0007F0C6EE|nr:DUF190 domain-containing protein [Arachidicoccus sp. BS20]ANI88953.1 hypothetical protein A9P82_06380 [Arachidicoccus sp. BS20]